MVQADPKNAVIRRQVQSVQFGFYTDEDVRSRSVVEVTSPQSLDALSRPLPRGLYDAKFGPTSNEGVPCITCGCPYQTCPGHAGHLELCVPVYHPLCFASLVKLLRIKCLNCHRLRADARQLEICKTKFSLLKRGRLQEALELDDTLAHATHRAKGSNQQQQQQDIELALDQVLIEKNDSNPHHAPHDECHEETSYERSMKRNLVKQVLSMCMGSKKCNHCGAFSPKIRQDSSNKIFQAAISHASARQNLANGIVIQSALGGNMETSQADGYNSDDTVERNEEDLELGDEDEDVGEGTGDKYMHALEVEAQIKWTWQLEPFLCDSLFGGGVEGYKIFSLRAIPIPPARFRPPMTLGTMTVEHAQNAHLNKMLVSNDRIRSLLMEEDNPKSQAMAYSVWIDLQTTVNCFMDSSKDPSAASSTIQSGIRQILEKKEGIFRKHMMGKRVDFACRSVISPDPYVGTNEIGIPLHFAKNLTYPTPVTDLNAVEMRQLVMRGPHEYPGACWVQFPDGRRVDLAKMDPNRREGVAARLLSHISQGGPPATVGRQLRNGDMMLVNRQPTLHKPGIMAHSVRVLYSPTQKTIRMHYANCNTYNADFDGDEMNCHFPQNDLASAESKYIAATDLQYIVPTDGSPLRGLIQDHVDSGVKMTCKDTFLEKWEYQQLIFSALASLPGLEVIRSDADIEVLPPAILKPRELWTGKQVISTLLQHLRKGNDRDDIGSRAGELPGISVERKAKTPESGFGASQQEHLVVIRDGELLRGVLDKAAFGSTEFSLVHAVYEAYGANKAGLLLNSLGRLFTAYLQYYSGHSCRMEDLILTKEADANRRTLVQRSYNVGARAAKAWADSEGGKVEIESVKDKVGAEEPLKPFEAAAASSKIGQLVSGNEGKTNSAGLDGYMQSQLNPLASEIIKACLPNGLAVPFPANTFGLMVSTGAKGSTVNQSQVSCALGQQALEGRRVPRLSSGRTLPSFAPYDPNPRADGFIMDRFLTGIRPQEYYFHCMAGREGLVDTAVKTSRSGYLQRCLVKHLEELKVCYDSTVRNSEGGVVQFLYGEDGLDPTKSTYLDHCSRTFEFMARNHDALALRNSALPDASIDLAAKDVEILRSVEKQSPSLIEVGAFVRARKLRVGSRWIRGAFCLGWYDAIVVKRHKDGSFDLRYIKDDHLAKRVPIEIDLGRCGSEKTPAVWNVCILIKAAVPDPVLSGGARETGNHRLGSSGACVSEKVADATSYALHTDKKLQVAMETVGLAAKGFRTLVAAKYGSAICAPGEAVGSIAAQSVGEPSTQMTLNTFHLAGSGANVTLGIPRLREIIMTASKELKTPTMSVPLDERVSDREALKLTRRFTKLTLMELISSHGGIEVREALEQGGGGNWERCYHVTLILHPAERVMEAFGLTSIDIATTAARAFMPKLADVMKRELRRSKTDGDVGSIEVQGGAASDFVDDFDDGGNRSTRRSSRSNDGDELEGDDDEVDDDEAVGEEDGVNAARYGRKEEMTYGDMDDDDRGVVIEASSDDEADSNDENGQKEAPQAVTDEASFDDKEQQEAQQISESTTFHSIQDGNSVKVDKERNALILQPLRVDPAARPLLMVGLVERAASTTLVRSRPKIQQAFINEEEGRGRCLQTAGVNFEEIWNLQTVNHDNLASNDIWAIRCAYGVEAARANIVDQIKSVFGAYGISVDPRHLSLIADYMTFEGGFKAMNRGGMADCSSPFLQMSFETTANFMMEAALNSRTEHLVSPSANIVLGRPIRHGTGAFDVLVGKLN